MTVAVVLSVAMASVFCRHLVGVFVTPQSEFMFAICIFVIICRSFLGIVSNGRQLYFRFVSFFSTHNKVILLLLISSLFFFFFCVSSFSVQRFPRGSLERYFV